MLAFDEPRLRKALSALPSRARLAFAVARATRQLSAYERFAELYPHNRPIRPRQIAASLWDKIQRSDLAVKGWPEVLDEVMALIPEEQPGHGFLDLIAQDSIASLAYAIRCLIFDDAQEAAWAARRAYEAADQAAIRSLNMAPATPGAEASILAHQFVQRTLASQNEDLALSTHQDIEALFRRSYSAPVFTRSELDHFAVA